MNDELNEVLDKIKKCKDEHNRTKKRLENIKRKYKMKLDELERELDGYYVEIYKKGLIKLSVKDLIDELEKTFNVKNISKEVSLNGFFVCSLKEDEDKKEAFEKIKLGYQGDHWNDMKISIYNSENNAILFNSIFSFNMNINTVLVDGSKLIDNFTMDDVEVSENTLLGKKSGIIILNEDILLKANLIINYEDLMDNSEYDEYCYPNVRVLREAIFNVLKKNTINTNIKR